VDADTFYGKTLRDITIQLTSGDNFEWTTINMRAMLNLLCAKSKPFADLLRAAHQTSPSSNVAPWNLVLYTDEAQPGNLLSYDTSRKAHAIYYTFIEFGPEVMCHETGWLVGGLLRSNIADDVPGGLSALIRILLRELYLQHGGVDVVGIVVQLAPGETLLLFIDLRIFLSDADAWSQVWHCKASKATKPCFFCLNAIQDTGSGEPISATDGFVSINCPDFAQFRPQTDDGIIALVDDLSHVRATRGVGVLKVTEQAYGWNHNPHSILQDLDLRPKVRPCKSTMLDWQHVWLVNGIANDEFYYLTHALKDKMGIRYAALREYCLDWNLANKGGSKVRNLFSEKRASADTNAGAFRAGSSEMLNIYAVIRYFLATQVAPELVEERRSFNALCNVLDALQSISRKTNAVTPAKLDELIGAHFRLHLTTYPREKLRPKWHWSLHFGHLLRRFGLLIACFTTERRHKIFKNLASHVLNNESFERTCLIDLIVHHIDQLNYGGGLRRGICLYGKGTVVPGKIELAHQYLPLGAILKEQGRAGIVVFSVDDFVLFIDDANTCKIGVILVLAQTAAGHYAIVKPCRCADEASSLFSFVPGHNVVQFHQIKDTLSWRRSAGGVIVTLPPFLAFPT